ncbi:MAG: hypothetical protein LBC20_06195 [Planctomycetaceae bacterium]|jgi:uncharacterized protein YgiM (DUF1202 family)|nr:hypothetical protein [Planctomycetaceae bacterium]
MPLLIFIILVFTFSSALTASEQYPYYASIAVTETFVRCGPGTEFYPTSQLWLGDKVEVYYETQNWCAIRPPIGSFSWISARYVDLGTNNIGSVITDGLASRVGSEITTLCDTVQVKLKKGEKVLVLDRIETPENIASPLWFKIVPPSGEFRWVPRDVLMASSSQISKQTSPKRMITQVTYDYDNLETNIKNEEISQAEPILPPPTRPVKLPTPQLTDLPVNKKIATKNTITELPPLSAKLASKQSNQNQITYSTKEPDPFQKAFEELKEETRIVLTRPTEDWVFDTLIHRGSELNEIAPTDADLEKVYHLVETLQRTKTIRQEIAMRRQFRNGYLPTSTSLTTPYSVNSSSGYTSNSGAPAPMNPATSKSVPKTQPVSKIATTVKTSVLVPLSTEKTTEFDLVGKLGEFQPLPKGHPPYALVNEKEEIICLVSPATGVDLKPYSGKTVGINGILGIFEKPNQPNRRHILAREVEIINPK